MEGGVGDGIGAKMHVKCLDQREVELIIAKCGVMTMGRVEWQHACRFSAALSEKEWEK